ncbi:MAG: aminoglycoside phosphotransferase family protein [Verrucomicrobiales bacterium]
MLAASLCPAPDLGRSALKRLIDLPDVTLESLSEQFQRKVKSVDLGEPFESGQAEWTPLKLCFDDDSTSDILHKRYLPENLEWGARELWFYQHCAGEMGNAIFAECYEMGEGDEEGMVWFLLEDLNGTHLKHQKGAEEKEIRQAIPTLVALHARWWEDHILDLDIFQRGRGGNCRMANACSAQNIRAMAANFLEHELPRSREMVGATFTEELMDLCIRVTQRWPDLLIDRIGEGQITMIHGDSHFENMFFPRDGSQQVKLIDWQSWERGIPAYDLAYMMMFSPETEKEAMSSYYEGLVAGGVSNYSRDRFERDYRLSVLCCLFPTMLWMRSWGGVWVLERALKNFERWNCHEFLG